MATLDIALVEERAGAVVVVAAHAANCPDVRLLAELGETVATLLGCETPIRLPTGFRVASCLAGELVTGPDGR